MSWREEMESHIAMRAEENERAGMDPTEARRAAERAFGNRALTGEAVRAVRVPVWLDRLMQDLRYAARGFARSPGFTLMALAALTVGIGASTAVFSFTDRILFRPLPYANEHELVWFGMMTPSIGLSEFVLEQNYMAWRGQATPLAALTVSAGVSDCSVTEPNPVPLRCARVTREFLSVFGYRPAAGRDFSADDARPGAPQAALISTGLWRQRFGAADPEGKVIEIDGNRTYVAGVLPENFEMPSLDHVDVLQVLQFEENLPASAPSLLVTAFGRLHPGVTPAEARARMEPLFQEGMKTLPRSFRKDMKFVMHPLRDRQARDSERAAWMLSGAVALVLLIAVANVANLMIARSAARRRELAVRAAIGADRARLTRQALTETLLLGAAGAASGLAFASILLRVFRQAAPAGIARLEQATVDWRVAGFALLAALTASLLCGVAPAMANPVMEELTGGRIAGRRREWLRPGLVISQIALSMALLSGAVLLVRSLQNLASTPLGMETSSILAAHVQLPDSRYPHAAQRAAFWRSVEERLRTTPGMRRWASPTRCLRRAALSNVRARASPSRAALRPPGYPRPEPLPSGTCRRPTYECCGFRCGADVCSRRTNEGSPL